MNVVFDTYAWIEYFLGSDQGKLVESYLGETVITPFIVLLELSYRADKEGWNFKQHLDFIKIHSRITGVTEEFILRFGQTYNRVKKEIAGIGMADVIILLTAIEGDAKILTGDEHFKDMPRTIFLK
jgi:predicted nucleic acid-binding protein